MGTTPVVLVVDDNADRRKLWSAALAGRGYKVITAANGAEGLFPAKPLPPPELVEAVDTMLRRGNPGAASFSA